MKALLTWTLLLGALGCQNEPAECSEDIPCEGFGETCVKGACVAKSCSNSNQCGIEEYCDGGACAQGCAEDTDCYPDSVCNTESNACKKRGCRDSNLDCGFGEYCDTSSGTCYDASGYYCRECQDDADCGGNGNICLGFGAYGSYCGVTCESTLDCPSAYECLPVSDASGNIFTNQCVTYCWMYIQDEARSAGRAAAPERPTVVSDECQVGVRP
jgi:hypothetical protein